MLFLTVGFLVNILRGFLRGRKIQSAAFNWRIFRHEITFATVNLLCSAFLLGGLITLLQNNGLITFNTGPVAWWVIPLEFALYFFAFDTYFYWLHRLMHIEPMYKWIHKIHHRSVSPNLLTTLSVSPFESLINGGFVPLFAATLTLHESTMALLAPCSIVMGLYVHSGHELLPRWWNKTWLTKWFITATFHDQHHRFFKGNYGGYTTIWDWVCGTVRPNYLSGFERVTSGASTAPANSAQQAG